MGVADRPTSPWRLGGLGLRDLGSRVWAELWDDEVLDRAAALSYYFVFALFPMMLFLATLFGLVPNARLMDALLGYLSTSLPPDAASMVMRTLNEILRDARGSLLSLGAVGALWAASAGMGSVMAALNVVYDAGEPRPWWHRRLVAVGLTVLFGVFITSALVLVVLGPEIALKIARTVGLGPVFTMVWTVARWPVALTLALLGVGLVYYLAPAVKQRWYWVTPGSALAVSGILLASAGLRLYVTEFADYNATYGSIGGAILLLLWLYVTSLVLLVGAEINAEIASAARRRAEPEAPRRERAAA